MRIRPLAVAAIAALAVVLSAGAAEAAPRAAAAVGYDVSYPQCGGSLPNSPAFGIVGVTDGRPYGDNPCLSTQYAWAVKAPKAPAFYLNTANPGAASTRVDWYGQTGPQACSPSSEAGCAYDYGYNAAAQAFADANAATGAAVTANWWLDVETANSWSSDVGLNVTDIQGSIDFLQAEGVSVGLYSTGAQWSQITGGATVALANWVAGAANAKRASALCGASFSGGGVALVQYPSGGFDADYAC
jgi:hypothetical protein